MLQEEGTNLSHSQVIPRRETTEVVLTSFAQQRLWFLDQLGTGAAYNIPMALRHTGRISVAALEGSLNEIVRRHEALRTTFKTADGSPTQVIADYVSEAMPVIDLSGKPEEARECEAQRLIVEESKQLFNLTEGPLFRAKLLRMSDEDHILLLTMHHIVSDGWSMGVFARELTALYSAFSNGDPSPLADLPIQYADFAVWQRNWLQGEVLETQLSYWQKQLDGISVLQLPTDRPRPRVQTFNGACQSLELSSMLTGELNALSKREGATLFMTLLAAFQTLLYRYTGQDDIVVGSPIANRNRTEIEGLIGFFVNSLAIRGDLSGNPSFRELLERVRGVALGAYAHQDLPFEKLVEVLRPERDMSHTPLFQVMFALQNAPMEALELTGLTTTLLEQGSIKAGYDLEFYLWEKMEGLGGMLIYNTDLFDVATITRMMGHYQNLLKGIVSDLNKRISELPLLTEAEKHHLLVELNDTKADYPQDQCVHQLFEAQVEQTPDAVALVFQDRQLTYGELNDKANQLVRYLGRLNVGPDVLVGVCMEHSVEMCIALLAILKAGGAYLPIDPSYPDERKNFMLMDAQVPVLLTRKRLLVGLPSKNIKVVNIDMEWEEITREPKDNPVSKASVDNLAYVIYTSGSTGKPKGVQISHRALVNHNLSIIENFGLQPNDRVLQFASISFDVAAEELFPSWLSGATVVLRLDESPISISDFLDFVKKERLTVLNLPSPYWHELVSELSRSEVQVPSTLRMMIVGSEVVLPEQYAAWQKLAGDRVCWRNAYGPTETTITATIYDPDKYQDNQKVESVPIGHPISNTQVYLLDRHLNPVPVGITGELYIGGQGLARGYRNHPALTAEKFIPNPFSDQPGTRLYRSGDLARYLPNGNIEFLGRRDHQVKIRGFRIEPGEIESVLKQHSAVQAAAVLAADEGERRSSMITKPSAGVVLNSDPAGEDAEVLNQQILSLDREIADELLVELENLPEDEVGLLLSKEA
ncbi:MAG: non-ribosomal peptide synthetase [Planctomycetota bacterium]